MRARTRSRRRLKKEQEKPMLHARQSRNMKNAGKGLVRRWSYSRVPLPKTTLTTVARMELLEQLTVQKRDPSKPELPPFDPVTRTSDFVSKVIPSFTKEQQQARGEFLRKRVRDTESKRRQEERSRRTSERTDKLEHNWQSSEKRALNRLSLDIDLHDRREEHRFRKAKMRYDTFMDALEEHEEKYGPALGRLEKARIAKLKGKPNPYRVPEKGDSDEPAELVIPPPIPMSRPHSSKRGSRGVSPSRRGMSPSRSRTGLR